IHDTSIDCTVHKSSISVDPSFGCGMFPSINPHLRRARNEVFIAFAHSS
ncbi:hypothetical protein A2U01_0096389, partial [Trifolium medium]|nr:hypothetical protein [Trifolium medium]